MPPLEPTDLVLTRCRELGFALAGVCSAGPIDRPDAYLRWLADGKQGEMGYMARHVDLRIDPAALVPGAKSIIAVADRYHVDGVGTRSGRKSKGADRPVSRSDSTASGSRDDQTTMVGRIARYARGDDYHKVIKRRLIELCDELRAMFPNECFRACVDTAPVMERDFAQRAGLGAIGKHTLLIERGAGSYLLLGEIITTLQLESTPEAEPDPCGSCTRCIDACPTGAITPWSVDAVKCISYLTIEHRGVIDERYHEPMGDWIFGCDICQEVCPHNQRTRAKRRIDVHPAYEERHVAFDLLEVLNWTEDDRRAVFTRSAMKRAKLDMMQRNAAIAAGHALSEGRVPADSDAGRSLRARLEFLAESDETSVALRHAAAASVRRAQQSRARK